MHRRATEGRARGRTPLGFRSTMISGRLVICGARGERGARMQRGAAREPEARALGRGGAAPSRRGKCAFGAACWRRVALSETAPTLNILGPLRCPLRWQPVRMYISDTSRRDFSRAVGARGAAGLFAFLRTACRRLARSVAASAKDRPSTSRSCLQRLPSRRTSHSIAQVSLTRWTLREVRPAAPVTAAHAGTASCAARTQAAGLGTR